VSRAAWLLGGNMCRGAAPCHQPHAAAMLPGLPPKAPCLLPCLRCPRQRPKMILRPLASPGEHSLSPPMHLPEPGLSPAPDPRGSLQNISSRSIPALPAYLAFERDKHQGQWTQPKARGPEPEPPSRAGRCGRRELRKGTRKRAAFPCPWMEEQDPDFSWVRTSAGARNTSPWLCHLYLRCAGMIPAPAGGGCS